MILALVEGSVKNRCNRPNEWIAHHGSAVEGKMDMLSVLLHEDGQVPGQDHSADAQSG